MSKTIKFENSDFIVIPDIDKDYIIYILQNFESGMLHNFEINSDKAYFFLTVSTIKLPNGYFGYGYKSNFLQFDNKPVFGSALNPFNTALQALKGCLSDVKKSPINNYFFGNQILDKFEKFINPQTLFDEIC